MALHTFPDVEQGTDEWHDLRRGLITASSIGALITTKTMKAADNDTSRGLLAAIVAERVTGHTEPGYSSWQMERGHIEEPLARDLYNAHHPGSEAVEMGFMIRDFGGFSLGFSPDGLVGENGFIEIKSRGQKKQVVTVLDGQVPPENRAQIEAGFLVTGREWCDYISYSNGMHLYTVRVTPDPIWQEALLEAAQAAERQMAEWIDTYLTRVEGLPLAPRIPDLEIR